MHQPVCVTEFRNTSDFETQSCVLITVSIESRMEGCDSKQVLRAKCSNRRLLVDWYS